jgi:ribonuclease BN (tRNA processing enzyme)
MRLRVLGCSGGIGRGRHTTCYRLDEHVLLDCGTGAGEMTAEEMLAVRHVFLTHAHMDHVAALPLLVDSLFDVLTAPLVVHALPEVVDVLKRCIFNWEMWPDFAELPDAEHPVMVYEPMRPGERVVADGKTFEMIPVDHQVTTVALHVTAGGRSLCYSGDTSTNDGLWEGLNARPPLDLLLVECAFPDEREELARLSKHYTPRLLAADLAKLRHRPRVALTHFKPRSEDAIWGECRRAIRGFALQRVHAGDVLEV